MLHLAPLRVTSYELRPTHHAEEDAVRGRGGVVGVDVHSVGAGEPGGVLADGEGYVVGAGLGVVLLHGANLRAFGAVPAGEHRGDVALAEGGLRRQVERLVRTVFSDGTTFPCGHVRGECAAGRLLLGGRGCWA